MNVLSLFDGISAGQVALQRAGIEYDKYYSSEIDKYAIAVTQYNFPDTIQIGDVTKIKATDLPKIDLLIGGSPCQGFSMAGKRLNFDDERSKLFFEFVRLLKEMKPKYFLLENVVMKKEWQDLISEYIGVKPVKINSALVSAQQRKRLYWTNIQNITQPKDKRIVLKDILLDGYTEKEKSRPVISSIGRTTQREYFQKWQGQLIFKKPIRVKQIGNGGQGQRIYSINGKSIALAANGGGQGAKTGLYEIKDYVRKLHPIECERLQTFTDNYTEYGMFGDVKRKISNTQRYKMLGNSWTINVIVHIFKNLKNGLLDE